MSGSYGSSSNGGSSIGGGGGSSGGSSSSKSSSSPRSSAPSPNSKSATDFAASIMRFHHATIHPQEYETGEEAKKPPPPMSRLLLPGRSCHHPVHIGSVAPLCRLAFSLVEHGDLPVSRQIAVSNLSCYCVP